MTIYRGIARDVSWIQIPKGGTTAPQHLLTFRIECINERGDIVQYIPAELERKKPTNVINDGDTIEVKGQFNNDQILQIQKLENGKTGVFIDVEVEKRRKSLLPSKFRRIIAVICFIFSIMLAIGLCEMDYLISRLICYVVTTIACTIVIFPITYLVTFLIRGLLFEFFRIGFDYRPKILENIYGSEQNRES